MLPETVPELNGVEEVKTVSPGSLKSPLWLKSMNNITWSVGINEETLTEKGSTELGNRLTVVRVLLKFSYIAVEAELLLIVL